MSETKRIQSFSLDRQGLARVLGSLEAEVMEAIWRKGQEVTIREVWEDLLLSREIAFNTVMTVMNRLVEKGVLRRERGREAYRYRPLQSRDEFMRDMSRRVARGLVNDFGESVIAPFVEALDEAHPGYLQALEEFIRRRRGQRGDHD